MHARTASLARRRHVAAARFVMLAVAAGALLLLGAGAAHGAPDAPTRAVAQVDHAQMLDVHAAPAADASMGPHAAHQAGPVVPSCATCDGHGDGTVVACALVALLAVLLAWPRVARTSWSLVLVRVWRRVAPPVARLAAAPPDLVALGISRT